MAEERLKDELAQITEHIQQGHNFLLSGGAGSGKTYTLVKVVRWIIENDPSSLVACITYTNAAVKEIAQRVNHENLRYQLSMISYGTISKIIRKNCAMWSLNF